MFKMEFVTMEQLEELRECVEVENIIYNGISSIDGTSQAYEIHTVFREHYTLYVK